MLYILFSISGKKKQLNKMSGILKYFIKASKQNILLNILNRLKNYTLKRIMRDLTRHVNMLKDIC